MNTISPDAQNRERELLMHMDQEKVPQAPGAETFAEPAPGAPSSPQATELDRLREQLEEAERERAQFKNLLQRVQADFSNYRRRMGEERDGIQKGANAQLIQKLLPALDDLERALSPGPTQEGDSESPFREGVQLISRKLLGALGEAGVQTIEPRGVPFDPWEHEAVSYQETSQYPEGQVLQLLQKGYRLHGRVLRPALVAVARAPAASNKQIPTTSVSEDTPTAPEKEA
ncbi:MAG: nucleotide exchange factor GrpE [Chloroflexi bacterium]|nr:nucleotide exchange factor GrpE [Chloroflexota bacterium]